MRITAPLIVLIGASTGCQFTGFSSTSLTPNEPSPPNASILVSEQQPAKPPLATGTVSTEIFVAPSGDDGASGTSPQSAFKTLERALRFYSDVKTGLTSTFSITLLPGIYYPSNTIHLTDAHSGLSEQAPLVIRAKTPGTVTLSGGVEVRNFVPDANGIWRADLGTTLSSANISDFRQLWVNGHRGVRARSEDGLGITMVRPSPAPSVSPFPKGGPTPYYQAADATISQWRYPQQVEIVSNVYWKQFRCRVQEVTRDADGRDRISVKEPCWTNAHSHLNLANPTKLYEFTIQAPSWIENAKELLDQPNEWYFEPSGKTLYYKPLSQESPANTVAIVPRLEKIFKIEGSSSSKPVRNLRIEGLNFAHTTWLGPNADDGFTEAQSNAIMLKRLDQSRIQRWDETASAWKDVRTISGGIGWYRKIKFAPISSRKLRLSFDTSRGAPTLSLFEVYDSSGNPALNLAARRPESPDGYPMYSASSTRSEKHSANRAFDDDFSDNWQGDPGTSDSKQWLEVDFGTATHLDTIVASETIRPIPNAVSVRFADGVSVTRCKLFHLGGAGLAISTGAKNSSITENLFSDIAGIAVEVGTWHEPHTLDENRLVRNHSVQNNLIFDAGAEYFSASAIVVGHTQDVSFQYNRIHAVPYSGFHVGALHGMMDVVTDFTRSGGFLPSPSVARNTHIERNEIFDHMQKLGDGGGVYFTGPNPGALVRENYIHHQGAAHGTIYLDNCASHITVEGNVIFNQGTEKCEKNDDNDLHIPYTAIIKGFDNVFQNNFSRQTACTDESGIPPSLRDMYWNRWKNDANGQAQLTEILNHPGDKTTWQPFLPQAFGHCFYGEKENLIPNNVSWPTQISSPSDSSVQSIVTAAGLTTEGAKEVEPANFPPAAIHAQCSKGKIEIDWSEVPGSQAYLFRLDDTSNNSACTDASGWYCPATSSLEKMLSVQSNRMSFNVVHPKQYRAWVHSSYRGKFSPPVATQITCSQRCDLAALANAEGDFAEAQAAYAYCMVLDRAASATEKANVAARIRAGTTLAAILGGFYSSTEFQQAFAPDSMDDSAFVSFLFRLLLEREATPSELTQYLSTLQSLPSANQRAAFFQAFLKEPLSVAKNPILFGQARVPVPD